MSKNIAEYVGAGRDPIQFGEEIFKSGRTKRKSLSTTGIKNKGTINSSASLKLKGGTHKS